MQRYNILQLDDNGDLREYTEKKATEVNLTYLGVASLNALEVALDSSSADIYVIDGNFPLSEGCIAEFLAPEAFRLIRAKYENPTIVIYSSVLGIEEIAHMHNVIGIDKGKFTSRKLVERIKILLEEQKAA